MPASSRAAPRHVLARIACAFVGGWVFVWGFTTLGIAALLAAGMGYDDARTLLYLLAFLVYLAALIGSFAAASVVRAGLLLFGGGAAMTALAFGLLRAGA